MFLPGMGNLRHFYCLQKLSGQIEAPDQRSGQLPPDLVPGVPGHREIVMQVVDAHMDIADKEENQAGKEPVIPRFSGSEQIAQQADKIEEGDQGLGVQRHACQREEEPEDAGSGKTLQPEKEETEDAGSGRGLPPDNGKGRLLDQAVAGLDTAEEANGHQVVF